MRFVAIFTLLLMLAPVARAEKIGSQWNDSNTVQLPGGPDTYPGDTSVPDQGTGGGTGTGQGGDAGGVGGGTNGTGSGNGGSGSSDIIIFSNSSPGSGSGSSGTAGGGDDTESLLDVLLGSGGLSGSSGGASTGSGLSGGISVLEGSGGVYIDGAKVRAALQGKGILRVTLRAFGAGSSALSNADLGLIGASTMLKNPSLESAFISLTRFDITYRSQGYLLAFIPVSFPIKISVNPSGASLAERVTVKFPWYSFFLRKFVSKAGLARDTDAILMKDDDPANDRSQLQAKIFTDVSIMLQSRIDTIGESVR